MGDNDFNNNVKHQMEGFSVVPSEDVWIQVEARIRKKKKRRGLIFFLIPLLIAGVAVFAYLNYDNNKTGKDTVAKNIVEDKTVSPVSNDNALKNNETNIDKMPSTSELHESITEKKNIKSNETIADKGEKGIGAAKKPVYKKQTKELSDIEAVTTNAETETTSPATPVLLKKETFRKDIELHQKETVSETDNNKPDLITRTLITKADLIVLAVNNPGSFFADENINIPSFMPELNLSIAAIDSSVKEKNKSKWQIGVMVKAGSFNITDKPVRFGNMYIAADYSNSQTNNQGPSAAPSSILKPAFSYGLGMEFKHLVGKRNYFVTGIVFSTYQTRRNIGVYVDSLLSVSNSSLNSNRGYYRTGSAFDFKSRYYNIEIPVAMQWRVNKNNKFPLYVETGFTYSRLLSSKGLLYSSAGNIYTDDKSVLNKNQLYSQMGILFPLLNNTKHPLQLGGCFQYGISRQYQQAVSESKHGRFVGLKLSMKL